MWRQGNRFGHRSIDETLGSNLTVSGCSFIPERSGARRVLSCSEQNGRLFFDWLISDARGVGLRVLCAIVIFGCAARIQPFTAVVFFFTVPQLWDVYFALVDLR